MRSIQLIYVNITAETKIYSLGFEIHVQWSITLNYIFYSGNKDYFIQWISLIEF